MNIYTILWVSVTVCGEISSLEEVCVLQVLYNVLLSCEVNVASGIKNKIWISMPWLLSIGSTVKVFFYNMHLRPEHFFFLLLPKMATKKNTYKTKELCLFCVFCANTVCLSHHWKGSRNHWIKTCFYSVLFWDFNSLLSSFLLFFSIPVLFLLLRADLMAFLSYDCSCNTRTVSTLVFHFIRSRCAL